MIVVVVLAVVYLGAWLGLTLAEQSGAGPGERIVWGFLGCYAAAFVCAVGLAWRVARRRRR